MIKFKEKNLVHIAN